MTRAQRVVRTVIRLLLPIFVLGAVGALAGTMLFGFHQQREVAHVRSPGGAYRASLVAEPASCGSSVSGLRTSVYVERARWRVLKDGVFSPFCVAGDASKVRLSWRDTETLAISCRGCAEGDYEATDTNWGKLRFAYDVEQP